MSSVAEELPAGSAQPPGVGAGIGIPRDVLHSATDSPSLLGGGSPLPPFHTGALGTRRAGWPVGGAPWGANEGLPCELSPTPISLLCPALPLPAPSLPRQVQAALPNACWQLLPPAPRGRAAARADEMRPDGPAMLYNGLRRGPGGPPSVDSPAQVVPGPMLHARCVAGGMREGFPHPGGKPVRVVPAGCFAFCSLRGVFHEDAVMGAEDALTVTGLMGREQLSRG